MSRKSTRSVKKHIAVKAAILLTAVLLCLAVLPIFAESSKASPLVSSEEESAAISSLPSLSAESAILIEYSTGRVIGEKNPDKTMPMASTTKIMTALVAIENSDISTPVSISKEAVGIEGSSIYLYEGEKLSMENLLYAMLLESANDAAAAIAINIAGSIEAFADMMNEKAADLGLTSTHFANPHGLDDPEHYTTARELAIIARAAMQNEVFKTIVSTYKTTIPLNETEGVRLLINHNKMLKGYSGAIGIKTGYTKKSGRCLVSAAEKDGVELICVTLNAPNDWQDHKAMLDHGFSIFESRLLCDEGEFRRIQPIIGGMEDYVVLENRECLRVTVPKGSPAVKETVELFPFSYAPVQSGEIMGRLTYSIDGKVIAETPIYATYTVEKADYEINLWERIRSFFGK